MSSSLSRATHCNCSAFYSSPLSLNLDVDVDDYSPHQNVDYRKREVEKVRPPTSFLDGQIGDARLPRRYQLRFVVSILLGYARGEYRQDPGDKTQKAGGNQVSIQRQFRSLWQFACFNIRSYDFVAHEEESRLETDHQGHAPL